MSASPAPTDRLIEMWTGPELDEFAIKAGLLLRARRWRPGPSELGGSDQLRAATAEIFDILADGYGSEASILDEVGSLDEVDWVRVYEALVHS